MKTEVSFFGTGGRNWEWAADKGFGRIRVAIKPGLTADVTVTQAVAESAERTDGDIMMSMLRGELSKQRR